MNSMKLLFTSPMTVNVADFIVKATVKYLKRGSIVTPELETTWKLNCQILNHAINHPATLMKYVVPAPTGVGKTENLLTYCSMLPVDITVLISTNLIDEANNLVNKINLEAQQPIAMAYHSKNKMSHDLAASIQILVTTHAFYKQHYKGSDTWNKVVSHRNLIVIDEALDTLEEIYVEDTSIARAILVFSYIQKSAKYKNNSQFKKELDYLKSDLDALQKSSPGTGLYSSDKLWAVSNKVTNKPVKILSLMFDKYKLFSQILGSPDMNGETNTSANKYGHSVKYSYILTGDYDESLNTMLRENLLETIVSLNKLRERQVYITANNGNKSFNRVEDMMFDKPLVCFDATASINKTYELREQYYNDIDMIERVNGVRDYSNVTLYQNTGNTGKLDFSKQVAVDILGSVTLGVKTLIVTHKRNEAIFDQIAKDKYSHKTIEVAHWNAITGLNTWKDFDTCIIAGLNNKPIFYSQNRLITNVSTEQIAFGVNQNDLNTAIGRSTITVEIIQAINRIRIRQITDEKGNCDPSNIYIILPKLSVSEHIRDIKREMPNINIKTWNISSNILTQGSSHFDTVIKYLEGNLVGNGTVAINIVRDNLVIKPDSFRTMLGKSKPKQQKFRDDLHKFGFEIIESSEGSRGKARLRNPKKYFHRI